MNKNVKLGAFFVLSAILLSSCRSTKADYERDGYLNGAYIGARKYPLKTALESPQEISSKRVAVEGYIRDMEVDKLHDVTLLAFELVDNGKKMDEHLKKRNLEFSSKWINVEGMYKELRLQTPSLNSHDAKKLNNYGFQFQIAARKLKAKSALYQGEKKKIAEALNDLADSLDLYATSYKGLAKQAKTLSLNSTKSTTSWQNLADKQLSKLNLLIDSIPLLLEGKKEIHSDHLTEMAANKLSSHGHELEVKAIQHQQRNEFEKQKLIAAHAQGFLSMGAAEKKFRSSLKALSGKLQAMHKIRFMIADRKKGESLRCAYYGYNNRHLTDLYNKLKKYQGHKITAYGYYLTDSLREEVDVQWIRLSALRVDTAVLDLSFEDQSETYKKTVSFYDWIGDVENE